MTFTSSPRSAGAQASASPMIRQYLAIKAQHMDCLLFYRLGDFYELFFDDAICAAAALDIVLTKRGRQHEEDIPMCGVPHHSYENYVSRLIRQGHKVALCEQMESPEEAKKRGYKEVVRREVVRIITPGTLVEESLLDTAESHFLLALCQQKEEIGLAWLDLSTGHLFTNTITPEALISEVERLAPKEILLSETLYNNVSFISLWHEWKKQISLQADSFFEKERAFFRLKNYYNVTSLESFGIFHPLEIATCGALHEYIELTHKKAVPHIMPPLSQAHCPTMFIDASTRKHLEIARTHCGEKKGSLLSVLDKTLTAAGSRLLAAYFATPLADPVPIDRRLDGVEFFLSKNALRGELRSILRHVPDIERAVSRICISRGTPRDLLALKEGLQAVSRIFALLEQAGQDPLPAFLQEAKAYLGCHDILIASLESALHEEVGFLFKAGSTIKDNHDAALDELRSVREESANAIADLREYYRAEINIPTLKIGQNDLVGYYIEVTSQHSHKLTPPLFTHKQTLSQGVRYTSDALKVIEIELTHAHNRAESYERELYDTLINKIKEEASSLSLTSQGVALIDVAASLGEIAYLHGYTRPIIDQSYSFSIQKGKHPVVESHLASQSKHGFIANNCDLSPFSMWLLTGPNMAGKSTFLRQNALIAIMAHIGSFVPAEHAHIGVIDRLFSRVGASDDLAKGRSTFMVEMVETASILHHATRRSFVILDEIGRGTSTYDGISIAFATIEHIHHLVQCRTLCATHYHELTCLGGRLARLGCYTMKIQVWKGEVVCLHEVVKGVAHHSYGIQVATLAGFPPSVTQRAKEILECLQNQDTHLLLNKVPETLPLFGGS